MSILNDSPSVSVKRKNIQAVIDYCLDQRIECKIIPRSMPDEYDVEFGITDVMKAISLGMFLKENKMELTGLGFSAPKNTSASPKTGRGSKKEKEEKTTPKAEEKIPAPENNNGLSFTPEQKNEAEIVTSAEPNPFEEEDLFMNN